MTKKVNLSEAAKDILHASVMAKRAARTDGPAKLTGTVAYGTHEAGLVGQSPEKKDETLPDYLKGTPSATPPGATPPVGKQQDGVGATKPKNQPQETMGRADLITTTQHDATHYEAIRDRIAGKLAPQMMIKNPGAHFQSYDGVQAESTELKPEGEQEVITDELSADEIAAQEAAEKEAAKKTRYESIQLAMKGKMKDDVAALVEGENLSEEFVTKATTIFEAAVVARSETIIEEVENQLIEQFTQSVELVKEELAGKIDDYLNYMVEEWMTTNEIAIETGLRTEIVEEFITELRDLFIKHNIDIPAEKVSVAEELAANVLELEERLNDEIKNSIELKKQLELQQKNQTIQTACEGLIQTQAEKLKTLAESVDFTTAEEFAGKIKVLKESYFKPEAIKSASTTALNEEITIEEEKKPTVGGEPSMDAYAKAISKTAKV